MRRISLVATLTVVLCLTVASAAFAHHVDGARSNVTCDKLIATFAGFQVSDGKVGWALIVDGKVWTSGGFAAFNGEKVLTQALTPMAKGDHVVVFSANWPTRGSNNDGSFTRTVTCPGPPPPPPCPNEPPTVPCNCPPGPTGPAGPAGPPGVTTTITVVENHTTVVYVDKTCTSQRVFRLTIAKRLPRDDVFGGDAGQKIVKARIVWRGADAAHKNVTKKATAKLRLGTAHDTDEHHMRLRVNASFRNVVAVPGQVRVIDEYDTLANGHVLHFIRKMRLCLPVRDGDMNAPQSLPQNGHSNGSAADEARATAAKAPKYRKAVI